MGEQNIDLSDDELLKRVTWYEKRYGPYIEKRGLHNWKNLFRRPTLLEWTVLGMLILVLFMTFAYQSDIKACQSNCDQICLARLTNSLVTNPNYTTTLILKEETNQTLLNDR